MTKMQSFQKAMIKVIYSENMIDINTIHLSLFLPIAHLAHLAPLLFKQASYILGFYMKLNHTTP